MENQEPKTANQLYRESGSTLSFAEWLEREKAKGTEMVNAEIKAAIERLNNGQEQRTRATNDLGLNKNVMVLGVIIIGAAIVWAVYNKKK
jgi:hypothetical protein